MKILFSAAETSSDAHAAQLLRAMRKLAAEKGVGEIDAFGVGGPALMAEGLRVIVDARELLAMGFVEILGSLPRILKALRTIGDAAEREKPALSILVDYPDFHFRLGRRLRRLGLPAAYYIPPKVWAWRKGRLRFLRENFAAILSILPFEVPFYREAGVAVNYVGNPLLDELPLGLSREEARARLGLGADHKIIVAMPGSRRAEIAIHTPLMLDGLTRAAAELRRKGALAAGERLVVLMPVPATADFDAFSLRVESWLRGMGGLLHGGKGFILDVRPSRGNSHECLVAADAGLVKSGTSTLEAGLLGCPHAVVYRPNPISILLYRLFVRYRGPVGLVNLVSGGLGEDAPRLMREILLGEVTPRNLAAEAVSLMTDSARLGRLREGMSELREIMARGLEGRSPSESAAAEILKLALEGKSGGA